MAAHAGVAEEAVVCEAVLAADASDEALEPAVDSHLLMGLELGEADHHVGLEHPAVDHVAMSAALVKRLDATGIIVGAAKDGITRRRPRRGQALASRVELDVVSSTATPLVHVEPVPKGLNQIDAARLHITPACTEGLGGIGPGIILFDAFPKGMNQPQQQRPVTFRRALDLSVELLDNILGVHGYG